MPHLICVENVSKIYPFGPQEVRALDRVSLYVDEGEFVSIVGSSGSGKSTLMNILGCLDVPTSGHYYLEGQDVALLRDGQLSHLRGDKIGFIFQSFNLIPTLDAVENVELPLTYQRMPKEQRYQRALWALEQVGLSDRAAHRPSQLSGGQQQRVAIARAIANKPKLLIADEPTGNLDPQKSDEIMSLLEKINREEKTTVLMVTHDITLVNKHRKRTIALEAGHIVADMNEGGYIKHD